MSGFLGDSCNIKHRLDESMRPLSYQTQTPLIKERYNTSPGFLMDDRGVKGCDIDIESDIFNINRPLSQCPSEKFPKYAINAGNVMPDTSIRTEYTREKRPCNVLSGVNINRFEALCNDFQDTKTIHNNCYIGLNTRSFERDSKRKLIEPIFEKDATECYISERKGYNFKCKNITEADKILPSNFKNLVQKGKKKKAPTCKITLE